MRRVIVAALLIPVVASAQGAPAAPRLLPVPDAQRTEEQRMIATEFAPGGMSNAVGTLLIYPPLARRIFTHDRYLATESTLPPRHRSLLALRAAWLSRSGYLWAHRAAMGSRAGLTDAELRRIAQGPDAAGWDAFEVSLLRAADELLVDSFIADATWTALDARYDLPQLIDTIDTVAATVMYAGLFNSLGIQIEPGIGDRLPTGIPYAASATRTNLRVVGTPRIPPTEPPPGGRGGGANVFRTFNRHPPADRVRGAINTHVNSTNTLTPKQRELLMTRIGVLCRSEYEYAAHLRLGRQAGFTDADVARVINGPNSGPGDPLETALLQATDDLFADVAISTTTWNTLAKSLNERQLIDVLITVGGYRSGSMLINTGGVQLDANMADFRFPESMRPVGTGR